MESIQDHLKALMNRGEITNQYHTILKEKVFADPDVKAFFANHQDSLDKDAIMKSASNLYEFVRQKEKRKANQPSLIYGHDPRLVLFNNRIHVEYVPSREEIDRRKSLEAKNRIKTMYISKDVVEANFDDLKTTSGKMEAINATLDFIEDYSTSPSDFHQGLYLYGSFGVGKTYLMGAMAKHMSEQGFQVTLVHFPTLCVEIKAGIKDNTVGERVQPYKDAEILILDDIGAETLTAWLRDEVLGIILQHRMQQNLSTFFTSNFSFKQLEDEHLRKASGDEPVKAARLMERIKYLAKDIQLVGKNQRQS